MHKALISTLFAGLLLGGSALAATEPDLEREKRMASQIVDAILDGDAVWLKDGDHEFLGLYTEPDQIGKAVIMLHGRGTHPDWQDVANPVRVGLVEHGWATLSLQMPVLEKEAKFYDYVPLLPAAFPRIEAGIDFLRDQGYEKIVIVAHSCSVHMAMAWLEKNGDKKIDGFVGLGMGATDFQQPMDKPFPLEQLSIPVLDAFGSEEYPAVRNGAPVRLQAISKAGNPYSRQIVIDGANHYFTDKGAEVTDAVAQWLNATKF
jgi:pimeloyl-ACP methyl ester carboxylesterase